MSRIASRINRLDRSFAGPLTSGSGFSPATAFSRRQQSSTEVFISEERDRHIRRNTIWHHGMSQLLPEKTDQFTRSQTYGLIIEVETTLIEARCICGCQLTGN